MRRRRSSSGSGPTSWSRGPPRTRRGSGGPVSRLAATRRLCGAERGDCPRSAPQSLRVAANPPARHMSTPAPAPREPQNWFYILLNLASVLFVVTALAYALVPVLEEKAAE